jgi:mRNA-degrading endonuclease RelE of RelBE toxin-antitoxin system
MLYTIKIKKSVLKSLKKLPVEIQNRFEILTKVLRHSGPKGAYIFKNYSKLGKNEYHCHLTYHYVACWKYEKGTITIEVYYVGSREKVPY